MSFTAELRASIEPIYRGIIAQPFIEELSNGTLSRERFGFYLKQDALYLRNFTRALAMAGVRATGVPELKAFLEFASGAIVVEGALHESYFEEFALYESVKQSPACFAYSNYLLAVTSIAPYEEAVAALLPCFWIYRDVGQSILDRAELSANPYRRWIETYGGEEFDIAVNRAIAIVDDVAADLNASRRARMQEAFATSSRLEWIFWDSAYRLEQWPGPSG